MEVHLKKSTFEILKKQIQIFEIKGQKTIDVKFLDNLRKNIQKSNFRQYQVILL